MAAGGGLNVANVWEWQDPEKRRNPLLLRGHTGIVSSVAFGPDDTLILTSGDDGTERLWDARTGLPISILSGHVGDGNRASFSRDGRLVVATDGRTALVYSCDKCAAAGELVGLVPEHLSSQSVVHGAGAATRPLLR
ncbi:MAG: hypothetical protein ABW208_13655 [Pyrinomonadaceae bacterium]